jgi:ABC-type sulfate/molybdate transport systems ATPase subunit
MKIRELSRGMGQLIQFAATIIHAPSFIVLDEPFSGLNSVNARLMKDIMVELNAKGTSILFWTHQMTDVEERSENVVMINQGEVVLDSRLDEIKRRFSGNAVYVELGGEAGLTPTASADEARTVASMVPFSAPLASLTRLGADGMGAIDLAISLSLLAASVAAVMWFTTQLFRAYLLMYGQRPGIRQIFRTLRAG